MRHCCIRHTHISLVCHSIYSSGHTTMARIVCDNSLQARQTMPRCVSLSNDIKLEIKYSTHINSILTHVGERKQNGSTTCRVQQLFAVMTRRHVSLSKHDEHVLFTMLAIPVVIAKFPSTGYERQDEDLVVMMTLTLMAITRRSWSSHMYMCI